MGWRRRVELIMRMVEKLGKMEGEGGGGDEPKNGNKMKGGRI